MTMKTMLRLCAVLSLMTVVPLYGTAKINTNPKPFTAPELREWKGASGTLTFTDASAVTYLTASLEPVAMQLASQYTALTGKPMAVRKGKGSDNDICLALKSNRKLGDEGYVMSVDDKVEISAPTINGVRWGCMTLLQMLSQSPALSKGTAVDWPAYPVRGLMMDAGRKYIPLEYLYKLVEDMAYYKMNRLHVHLNDNGFKYYFDDDWDKTPAAFRMESEIFPGLTARDGSYSKKEYREFQKYAASRGVDIVSEIDVPAHSLALTRYMPAIASTDGRNGADHLNLNAPETYEFLDRLIAEYIGGDDPVFISPNFHIGTDEYQGDSITMEKFRAFTDRYIKYVQKLGKKPLVWGSLSHAKGNTPVQSNGVEMYLWYNGYAQPKDMLELGYEVISIPDGYVYIVPNAGYYYDYLNNELLYKDWTPANIGGEKFDEGHPQIKGGMFAVWNDHPNNGTTTRDIHHRVMRSLPVMATKTWDGSHVTLTYEVFDKKSNILGEAPGVNYLAKQGKVPDTVLDLAEVIPGMILPIDEIGYDYSVEFDIEGANDSTGTVLFRTPEATFWLSDPITGNMGYSREGQLNSFRFNVLSGKKYHVRVDGTNRTVSLYVDGKLVDDMNTRWLSYNGKNKMAQVRTLVFPLKQAGDFKSRVTNLKVRNYIPEK